MQKEKEEGGEAEARRCQDPVSEPRSETKAAKNQPGPSNDKEDVLPSAGSSAALQPETCVSQAGADLDTKDMSAPPPGQQVETDGGSEPSEPKQEAESEDPPGGAQNSGPKQEAECKDSTGGAQNSDSISG